MTLFLTLLLHVSQSVPPCVCGAVCGTDGLSFGPRIAINNLNIFAIFLALGRYGALSCVCVTCLYCTETIREYNDILQAIFKDDVSSGLTESVLGCDLTLTL